MRGYQPRARGLRTYRDTSIRTQLVPLCSSARSGICTSSRDRELRLFGREALAISTLPALGQPGELACDRIVEDRG